MKHKKNLKYLAFFFITLIIFLFAYQRQQELRTRASTATRIYFSPESSLLKPLEKKMGEQFSLDVMLDPSINTISLLKLRIQFNSTAFTGVDKKTFTVNSDAFPTVMEGPIVDNDNGYIFITLSIGADRTKAINKPTKIGTINLIAREPTNIINSTIVFDSKTQAFSISPNDHAFENVIGSAIPAYIAVTDSSFPSPIPTDANEENPIPTTDSTPPPTPTQIPDLPTPTPNPNNAVISFETFLHGIGAAGDNVNPLGNSLSNKNPQNPKRNVTLDIFDTQNKQLLSKNGLAIYDSTSGSFKGTFDLGSNFLTGNYILKLKSDAYLRKQLPGVQTIKIASKTTVRQSTLVAGDINNDNIINVLDYNLLTSCFSDLVANTTCNPAERRNADLTDNNNVDQLDYNLFIREISAQKGE